MWYMSCFYINTTNNLFSPKFIFSTALMKRKYTRKVFHFDLRRNITLFRFIGDLFLFEISEAANISAYITTVTAHDSDVTSTFNQVFYSLFDSSDAFQINSDTGVITVNKPLDRERNHRYELQLSAFNLVNESQAAITTSTVSDTAQIPKPHLTSCCGNFLETSNIQINFPRNFPETLHFHKIYTPGN